MFFARTNIGRKKLIQHQEVVEIKVKQHAYGTSPMWQKSVSDFKPLCWQIKNKPCLVWLAAYCWIWGRFNLLSGRSLTSPLRRRATCLLSFYFFICAVFVKGKFPEPSCNWCYSSCAVCSTLNRNGRKNDLENYFMCVIGDYRHAASACAWCWQRHAGPHGSQQRPE